ncbi:hypothetical protein ACFQL1_14415 [Halomicroarcula sp. GCM10025709]|uniref:DUF7311 family protein n=1 Tax=Haloarcula TaxID=2237 RepID=UPI0024C39C6B|nr:hypothetical protein [Halomicroarcula sp. YJ-61-S]
MIVRLVLAVVVTAALIGASMPGVRTVRADHADATVARQLETLSTRLQAMVERDDPTVGPGAQLRADVRLPRRSFTRSRITALSFLSDGDTTVATWRVSDGGRTRRLLVDFPLRTAGTEFTLRAAGTHRLVFGYRHHNGSRVVTVRRFKSDAAATTGYV